jgi:hypothetical protein
MPASYHIAQELQKYNIPDYRPRQEQCALRFSIKLASNPCAQIPKSDQESSRCTKNEAQPGFRVHSDGEWHEAGPGTVDSGVRHFAECCETVWVLIHWWRDRVILLHFSLLQCGSRFRYNLL